MNPKDPLDHLENYYQALREAPVPITAVKRSAPLREGAFGICIGAAVAALVLFVTMRVAVTSAPVSPGWGIDPGVTAQEPEVTKSRTEVASWRI